VTVPGGTQFLSWLNSLPRNLAVKCGFSVTFQGQQIAYKTNRNCEVGVLPGLRLRKQKLKEKLV
jgi:hypothetical protein